MEAVADHLGQHRLVRFTEFDLPLEILLYSARWVRFLLRLGQVRNPVEFRDFYGGDQGPKGQKGPKVPRYSFGPFGPRVP